MAADLQFLINLAESLPIVGLAAVLGYLALIATVALTAVFAKDPSRQAVALEVLRVLRAGWRHRRPPDNDEPRSLPPPNL